MSNPLFRTMRDIADGHITLWVDVWWFDVHTGQQLNHLRVGATYPDRRPSAGLPDYDGEWWLPLVERGWLRLPAPGERQTWHVTDAGYQWLVAHGREE